ncbi:MAG TPA: hypothetical protein DCM86_14045 [Verrucomicrobiales bacterium]|nr:hypothetical protein [Verrucomicrobiales bacterium]
MSISPRHPDRHPVEAFTLVWVLITIGALAALAMVLVPNGAESRDSELSAREEALLPRITSALETHAVRHQVIPGPSDWLDAVAVTGGLDTNSVRLTFPQFSTDTTSQRLYLIDPRFQPNLVGGILPLALPTAGIDAASPNAPNTYARAIVLSVSKRGFPLPLASGIITAAQFDGLWDWVNDPAANTTPLTGINALWNRPLGAHLHVGRVNYQGLFHLISFRKLTYAVDGGIPVMVTNTSQRYFLTGTPLSLYALTNGMMVMRHVVSQDQSFDLGSPYEPLGWWKFEDAIGSTVGLNLGKLGSIANASLTNGCLTGSSTLTVPTYTGYPTNNQALHLDGVDDYADSTQLIANDLSQFTLSAWVNPTDLSPGAALGVCGQYGVLAFGFKAGGVRDLEIKTAGGGTLSAPYPHPASEWHHVAVTGDGIQLKLYVDSVLVATGGVAPPGGSYGTGATSFRIGGGGIFDPVGNSFPGELDEVCVWDKALSAVQIAALKVNIMPF